MAHKFQEGQQVRRADTRARYGDGDVRIGDIGTVTEVRGNRIRVNFPRQSGWVADPVDIEPVEAAYTPKEIAVAEFMLISNR